MSESIIRSTEEVLKLSRGDAWSNTRQSAPVIRSRRMLA